MAFEYIPAVHDEQADMLAALEYWPAGQAVQALSWEELQTVDAKEPAGQTWHVRQYIGPVTVLSSGPIRPYSEPPASGPSSFPPLPPTYDTDQPPNQVQPQNQA